MIGSVGILNVGAGDTKLSFDPSKPKEVERAAKIVTDMIRRGYCLLVKVGVDGEGDDVFKRAKAFDEKTCEYIIADVDGEIAATLAQNNIQLKDVPGGSQAAGKAKAEKGTSAGGKGRSKVARIPAASTRAVAVAHSAGG